MTTLITGTTHAELGQDTERYTAGDVCLGSFPVGITWSSATGCWSVSSPCPLPRLPRPPGRGPASSGRRCGSLRCARRRRPPPGSGSAPPRSRGLLEDDQTAASPLIIGSAARLLAVTVLATFPNNVLTDPTVEDSRDAHP